MDKVLVANRGEIAVRILRAAVELGLRTVAVHTHADRESLHRFKADEAYQVGPPERPLAGYLDPEALVEIAVRAGAEALHPGYGFLSESARLADRCATASITFVGPSAAVLALTGDKVRAREVAVRAGVPVLAASPLLEHEGDAADLPGSVLGFLEGELGEPPFGWPEPLRSRVVTATSDPGAASDPGTAPDPEELGDGTAAAMADPARRRATVTELLTPGSARSQRDIEREYGEVWRLPTASFFYGLAPDEEVAIDLEPGKQLLVELEAITEPDDVAATLTGVVSVSVAVDDEVADGEVVATVEAMKMESRVTAPCAGRVRRIVAPTGTNIEPGDLLLEIR